MGQLIIKHYYSDFECNVLSDISFDIYKSYKQLYECVLHKYALFAKKSGITFDESNILLYRCGSVSQLGEFTIYANPLPIYLKDVKEFLKNG